MSSQTLPRLETLAPDLVGASAFRRRLALSRPALYLGAYAAVCALGLWPAAPLALFLLVVAVVSTMHDVVHGTLGLRRRGTDWALFALGSLVLESASRRRNADAPT